MEGLNPREVDALARKMAALQRRASAHTRYALRDTQEATANSRSRRMATRLGRLEDQERLLRRRLTSLEVRLDRSVAAQRRVSQAEGRRSVKVGQHPGSSGNPTTGAGWNRPIAGSTARAGCPPWAQVALDQMPPWMRSWFPDNWSPFLNREYLPGSLVSSVFPGGQTRNRSLFWIGPSRDAAAMTSLIALAALWGNPAVFKLLGVLGGHSGRVGAGRDPVRLWEAAGSDGGESQSEGSSTGGGSAGNTQSGGQQLIGSEPGNETTASDGATATQPTPQPSAADGNTSTPAPGQGESLAANTQSNGPDHPGAGPGTSGSTGTSTPAAGQGESLAADTQSNGPDHSGTGPGASAGTGAPAAGGGAAVNQGSSGNPGEGRGPEEGSSRISEMGRGASQGVGGTEDALGEVLGGSNAALRQEEEGGVPWPMVGLVGAGLIAAAAVLGREAGKSGGERKKLATEMQRPIAEAVARGEKPQRQFGTAALGNRSALLGPGLGPDASQPSTRGILGTTRATSGVVA